MNLAASRLKPLLLLLALVPWSAAWAQWELVNDRSSISFVSIKNGSVGEVHGFASLVGFVNDDGNVQVGIDLDSVETLIDIRNERVRRLLFETAKFPTANISAQVEPALLAAAAEGSTVTAKVPVTVALHGREKTLSVLIVAVGERDGPLQVFSAEPILVDAADFGLEAGVEALREIAGLKTLSSAVPVTLHLVFARAE